MAHLRQSRPDYDRGVHVNFLESSHGVPVSLGRGLAIHSTHLFEVPERLGYLFDAVVRRIQHPQLILERCVVSELIAWNPWLITIVVA